ncbi:head-to-tail connector protein [Xanthomonas phage Langgrundblatt1]|uniref:Head-to-tail connector protein n=1 Tax=Xanthomonas phage Langgrundblatt1 TaxID=2939128 RepID=A0A9E7E0T3_9CAUD|nr:head-to-tail connector protein [Xanthomonas phage Langgrundblatt1]URA06772.1 head-to-tail connector protein [Xanthomonas phage Langgrundblatt1]
MTIRIDDDVPLPQPDKVDTWQTGPHKPIRSTDPELDAALTKDAAYIEAMGGDSGPTLDDIDPPTCPVCDQAFFFKRCTGCGYEGETFQQEYPTEIKGDWVSGPKRVAMKDLEPKWTPVEQLSRYPAETTYDAKGVPTVDCYLVGGPLNGRHGPIVGTAQVVELDIYAADGSVSSVELYELGDRKELGCRYWKATKA